MWENVIKPKLLKYINFFAQIIPSAAIKPISNMEIFNETLTVLWFEDIFQQNNINETLE